MNSIERRNWTAPDGIDYRVSIQEFTMDTLRQVRRRKRIEFESLDGRIIGSTTFPGYLTLDLASWGELEGLWGLAVGE